MLHSTEYETVFLSTDFLTRPVECENDGDDFQVITASIPAHVTGTDDGETRGSKVLRVLFLSLSE